MRYIYEQGCFQVSALLTRIETYAGQRLFHSRLGRTTLRMSAGSESMTVARPACKCQKMWQWNIHGPGERLSASPKGRKVGLITEIISPETDSGSGTTNASDLTRVR